MNIPKTLEECYTELENLEDLEEWLNLNDKESSAVSLSHHGLGTWIRNNWGLWEGKGELYNWFKENEINHPDDMSGIIITSFYRFKHNIDIKLDEQINDSVEYYLNDNQKLLRQRKIKLDKLNDENLL